MGGRRHSTHRGDSGERARGDHLAVELEVDGERRAVLGVQQEVARLVVRHDADGQPRLVALDAALGPADGDEPLVARRLQRLGAVA